MDSAVMKIGFFFNQENSEPLLNIFWMQADKLIGENFLKKRE